MNCGFDCARAEPRATPKTMARASAVRCMAVPCDCPCRAQGMSARTANAPQCSRNSYHKRAFRSLPPARATRGDVRDEPLHPFRILVEITLEYSERGKSRGSRLVIAGLVPAISIRRAQCADYRDGRDKPGHDQVGTATSFAPITDDMAKFACLCSRQAIIPEETMKYVKLTMTAIALSVAATGLSTINAAEQQLNPKAITIKLPDQIPWKRSSAGTNETAVLYGEPDKPGPYVLMFKWLPGQMSRPHWHPNDRMITVLKGTWWVGTGDKYDPDSTVPLPAGSYVTHFAKEIHYDGAKDGEAWLLMAGEGPATSTPASTPPPAH